MPAPAASHGVLTSSPAATTASREETDILKVVESLDEDMKATFNEAWEKHRDLVRRETPFSRFIKTDKGNLDLAAKRLVGHWEMRKDLFGERAFYPMILDRQQERGALAYEDIEILETGFNTFLPDREDGSPALFYDLSRLEKDMTTGKGKHRCNFYLLHVASEDAKAQTVGITMVRYTVGTTFNLNMQPFMALLRAMPCILRKVERVIYHAPGATRMVQQTIVPVKKRTIPEDFRHALRMHTSDNIQEIASSLTKAGFSLSGLPECLGGTTKYEDLIRFDLTPKAASAEEPEKRPAESSARSCASKNSRKRPLAGFPSIAEKSRKQRTKEKTNLEALKKEVADLQSENRYLQQEGSCLERLVEMANTEVTKFLQAKASPVGLGGSIGLQQPRSVPSSAQVLPSCDSFMSQVPTDSNIAMLHHIVRPPNQVRIPGYSGIGGAQQGQALTSSFQTPAFNLEAAIRNELLLMNPTQAPFLAIPTRQSVDVRNFQDPGQGRLPIVGSADPALLLHMLRAGSTTTSRQSQEATHTDPAVLALLAEIQRRNGSL